MTVRDDPRDDPRPLMLWHYVKIHGSKITSRKCSFDPENLCDMLCSNSKINIIPRVTTRMKGDSYHAVCYCTKFEPPAKFEVIMIYPLEKEKDEE